MDGSQDFSASRLSFEVTGEGVAIDPASGLLSIPVDRLDTGITVTVTATDAAGSTVGRYRLTLAALATSAAPALRTAPALAGSAGTPAGTAVIGAPVTLDPGAWYGTPAPSLAVAWLLDGAVVAGATGLSYVPQPADDGRALSARVTATNAAGSAAAETAARAIVHALPTVVAPLADVAADAGAAPVAVEAAAAFAGAALTFAVSGTGATIDSATGVVTIATDQLLDGERITVTATNSGGSAQASFLATVRATPSVCRRQPALAGAPGVKAVIGTPVALDPGAWEGMPAPELAIAWLLDGAVVEGATGTSYTPVAADDGKRLSARVTATNAAGAASAETAARAIVHAAPTVVAPLADRGLFVGDAPAVVEAAAAFAGSSLVFAVEGGGATVDAKGRVSVPATAAGSATVTVTATNSGGSARVSFVATVSVRIVPPVLVLAPVLAGTGRIGAPVTVSAGSWSGVPAPSTSVAWLRDGTAIAGATGTSYTPVAADDGKRLSARVTATNAGGSVGTVTAALSITYAPPVAKGALVEEIFDLGSGVETVAAGADFTGENLSFAVTGAGATIDAKTGLVSIPTDKAVQATVTVTATNSGGSARSSFQVTVEAEDIPFALEAEDVEVVSAIWRPEAQQTWLTPAVRFPGIAGETVNAIEWTTSSKNPIPETEYEVVTKVGTGYQLYMRDAAKNAPGATPRVDYSVFKLDETARRQALRFRWRRTAEGPWSAVSPAFAVPAVPAPAPEEPEEVAGRALPMVVRTPGEYAAGRIGGPGFQVLRSYATTAADPNLLLCAMDQNFPWQSNDFGTSFFTPEWEGMWVGRTGVSAWIDPEDADRQLLMYSTGGNYFETDFDAYSGAYLTTDGGLTATRVLSLPLLTGTQTVRHNLHLIAHAPGGTPTTRTIYLMQISHAASSSTAATIQLWRSTNGGTSWSKRGSELAVGTYASGAAGPYGIGVAPNGDLYQWGRMGAWRSTDGGTSWTKLSSLPSGEVHQMDVAGGGGEVWAIVASNGLYKATNGVTFSKNTALGTKKATSFGISPADRNRIVVQIAQQEAPSWSHDGGATWAVGNTFEQIDQDDTFEHKMGSSDHNGIVPKINNADVWFAWRNMHCGISRDGGRTWNWTGDYYDGTDTRGFGFHPTDWEYFVQAQQDTCLQITQDGGLVWTRSSITTSNAAGQAIMTAVGDNQYIAGGCALISTTGRVVSLQGHVLTGRVPVVMYPSGGDPIGNNLVKGSLPSLSKLSEYYGALNPRDVNTGWLGRYRVGALNAGSPSDVTFTEMERHFIGAYDTGSATVIYGANKAGPTDKNIYRSTNLGDSWSLWHAAASSFRPVDNTPALAVCPHNNYRVYAASGAGRVVRIEGSTPTETEIFDARDYLVSGHPKYAIHSIAVDPFDEDLLYIALSMWGVPNAFRSTDGGATWEDISEGLPSSDLRVFVHPLTSDVLMCGSHGTHVLPPPAGHRKTYSIANSVYDRVRTFLASHN